MRSRSGSGGRKGGERKGAFRPKAWSSARRPTIETKNCLGFSRNFHRRKSPVSASIRANPIRDRPIRAGARLLRGGGGNKVIGSDRRQIWTEGSPRRAGHVGENFVEIGRTRSALGGADGVHGGPFLQPLRPSPWAMALLRGAQFIPRVCGQPLGHGLSSGEVPQRLWGAQGGQKKGRISAESRV